ncbi:unnamed protein product [Prunus brigantina]
MSNSTIFIKSVVGPVKIVIPGCEQGITGFCIPYSWDTIQRNSASPYPFSSYSLCIASYFVYCHPLYSSLTPNTSLIIYALVSNSHPPPLGEANQAAPQNQSCHQSWFFSHKLALNLRSLPRIESSSGASSESTAISFPFHGSSHRCLPAPCLYFVLRVHVPVPYCSQASAHLSLLFKVLHHCLPLKLSHLPQIPMVCVA